MINTFFFSADGDTRWLEVPKDHWRASLRDDILAGVIRVSKMAFGRI